MKKCVTKLYNMIPFSILCHLVQRGGGGWKEEGKEEKGGGWGWGRRTHTKMLAMGQRIMDKFYIKVSECIYLKFLIFNMFCDKTINLKI